ncbi:MAG: hypothetical protein JST44_24315 [Cyanobacteria bacterium SZAS LIN-5]|nr:hypothetical protein [Cyanobacteria bacterium SZAS LIN-5]
MEKIAPDEQMTDLNLVGFEKVFVQVEQQTNSEQITADLNIHEQIHELDAESYELISMAEASRRLKMPYPTLRRQVLSGKISSASGPDGKLMVKLLTSEHSPSTNEQKTNKSESNPLQSEHSLTIQTLLEQMEAERNYSRSLNERLEAANHRNGYLEAQVDQQSKQIKLLTDSQHKPGFWSQFSSWFLGKSV